MALVTTGLILVGAVLALALVWALMSNGELRDEMAAERRVCRAAEIDRCALRRDRHLMAAAEHSHQQMREAWDAARSARQAEADARVRIARLEAELRAGGRDEADSTAALVVFTADGRLARGPGARASGEGE